MTKLPDPVLEERDGFTIVRDDLLPGGTKRRAIHALFSDATEYVYASPVYGHAQLALAYAARDYGKHATIFCAARKELHPLTKAAQDAGATIREVPMGFLSNVQSKARCYVADLAGEGYSVRMLPFGLDDARFILALAEVARAMPVQPKQVWSITSSGVLTRALQLAWPDAKFFGVKVGAQPDAGVATVFEAPERFEQAARILPPYPSAPQYDAKLWRFVKQYAAPGALVWNVA